MHSFKLWLQKNEGMGGPGGGMEPQSVDQEKLGMNIASKGAGAFKTYNNNENPPHPRVRSPLAKYAVKNFCHKK